MEVGKFPASLLERILAKVDISDPRVVVGPRVGEDTAVLQTSGSLLVAKSDPVTFATDQIGWYAVQVNANDVACTGGTPKWFLATLLVPERFTEDEAEAVFDQILEACRSIDVSLVGGHSEVTYGIDRPIIMGTMLGEVEQDKLILTGGAQEGDSIVVTKGIAIEGTALLAREKASQLLQAGMSQEEIDKAASLLSVPGISVLHDARVACASSQVHSMHDVTEGGLVTGLREVAKASGLGLAIEESSVPILSECQEVCEALGLDPLGLLASGALLITLPTADVPGLLTSLEGEGINGFEIGTMIEAAEGLQMVEFHGETPLPEFSRDELARYMSSGA
ncbi:MAG: AIR synthase family protein [Chloroflexota bacterium]|nr:AIR synthase family protein [Chloroflexota bacterium]